MIKAFPVNKRSEAELLCSRYGIKYQENDDILSYKITEDNVDTGICIFSINTNEARILDIGTQSDELSLILLRATLLFCSMHGAKLAHFKQASELDHSILTKLGFTLENGIYSVCLN